MNILIDGQTLETDEIHRGIGVYFKNVLYYMVRNHPGVIWHIAVSRQEVVNLLDPWIARQMIPIIDGIFQPSFDYGLETIFTEKLNEVIEEYHIDCMWIPNPLMVNVLFPNNKINCELFVTVYDLIPYIMPVQEWELTITNEYNRRLEYLKDVHMICISNAAKQDVCARMGDDISVYVSEGAANSRLFYHKREKINGSDEVIIVYTGGFDYRKNIYGAIEAFALTKKQIQHKKLLFYIVCKYTSKEKEEFVQKVNELEISDNIVLTGFITDDQLSDLYNRADVFFFPSLYEGFGLPLLEAMLGGAYILSADNSSLPEVCGEHAMYCDAKDVNHMAEKLIDAINASVSESLENKQKRQEYALNFTWEKTAWKTFQAFDENVCKKKEAKKKLALVTPWLKQQTGIANFVYRLTPYLSKYFYVDIFIDNTLDNAVEFLPYKHGNKYFLEELDARHEQYDEIIYHFGNNTLYHTGIYHYMKKYPGIVELHDFVIHPFFYHSYYLKGDKETYKEALVNGYGKEGALHFEQVDSQKKSPDDRKFPMSESVAAVAKKIIVHNFWSYQKLSNKSNKYVIPHPCFDREELSANRRRMANACIQKKMNQQVGGKIIGCFGWINENKRPGILIQALSKLVSWNYDVRLIFFGKNNSQDILEEARRGQMKEYIEVTGYISSDEYILALKECDIVVNLKFPSMGESSGTLCEALKEGKATIVSAVNQYMEFPDDVCWKLPVCRYESAILADMIKYLLDHDDARKALEQNAKRYADEILNGENIAGMYAGII